MKLEVQADRIATIRVFVNAFVNLGLNAYRTSINLNEGWGIVTKVLVNAFVNLGAANAQVDKSECCGSACISRLNICKTSSAAPQPDTRIHTLTFLHSSQITREFRVREKEFGNLAFSVFVLCVEEEEEEEE